MMHQTASVIGIVLFALAIGRLRSNVTDNGQYKKVLELTDECQDKGLYYMTQYEKYLVTWDGEDAFRCFVSFEAKNDNNVITDYKVCFRLLNQNNFSDCTVELEYYDTGSKHAHIPSVLYTCNDTVPQEWCSDTPKGKVIIFTTQISETSHFRIEVVAYAGVNLSKVEVSVIIVAIFALFVILIVIYVKRNGNETSDVSEISTASEIVKTEDILKD